MMIKAGPDANVHEICSLTADIDSTNAEAGTVQSATGHENKSRGRNLFKRLFLDKLKSLSLSRCSFGTKLTKEVETLIARINAARKIKGRGRKERRRNTRVARIREERGTRRERKRDRE